jgi:hypothetical protein
VTPPAPTELVPERVEPVAGGRLEAADLRDLAWLADHQRARHVRALHDTWGIAAGLRLTADAGGPVVRPGVAYDRCGRLLVLPATVPLTRSRRRPPERRLVVLRADLATGEPAATLHIVLPGEAADRDVMLGVVFGEFDWDNVGRRYARTAAPVAVAAGRVRHGTLLAQGTEQEWTTAITVTPAFADAPVYVAGVSAGHAPAGAGPITVEVSDARADGFSVTVRTSGAARIPGVLAAQIAAPPPPAPFPTPLDINWIAALPQAAAAVSDPAPPPGPCSGPLAERNHR